jgi:hypothetical protein
VGKQTAAYPPYSARHLELPENSCMDLPTDFDCSVHIQLRFGGNHIEKSDYHRNSAGAECGALYFFQARFRGGFRHERWVRPYRAHRLTRPPQCQPVGKQTAAYPPYGDRHLELPENSCMDLPTDFDCSVHIQLRFGGNHNNQCRQIIFRENKHRHLAQLFPIFRQLPFYIAKWRIRHLYNNLKGI